MTDEVAKHVEAALNAARHTIERAEAGGMSKYSAALKALRPHVKAWAGVADTGDRRAKDWLVSAAIIDWRKDADTVTGQYIVATDGRREATPESDFTPGDADTVTGAGGFTAHALACIEAAGLAPDTFGDMRRAFDGLRPTLSRQGRLGKWSRMRRRSACGNFSLWADIIAA